MVGLRFHVGCWAGLLRCRFLFLTGKEWKSINKVITNNRFLYHLRWCVVRYHLCDTFENRSVERFFWPVNMTYLIYPSRYLLSISIFSFDLGSDRGFLFYIVIVNNLFELVFFITEFTELFFWQCISRCFCIVNNTIYFSDAVFHKISFLGGVLPRLVISG